MDFQAKYPLDFTLIFHIVIYYVEDVSVRSRGVEDGFCKNFSYSRQIPQRFNFYGGFSCRRFLNGFSPARAIVVRLMPRTAGLWLLDGQRFGFELCGQFLPGTGVQDLLFRLSPCVGRKP